MKNQLLQYITSCFPLILIQTNEYERAESIIIDTINELNSKILPKCGASEELKTMGYQTLKWDCIVGLTDAWGKSIPATTEPDAQINYLLNEVNTPTIVIAFNLQMFWDVNNGYGPLLPRLIELFRKFYKHGVERNTHIIVIGDGAIPAEIRSYFVTIDMPLPDRDTIKEIVSKISSSILNKNPKKVDLEEIVNACTGMDSREIENAIYVSIVNSGKKLSISRKKLFEEKAKVVRKSGLLEWVRVEETLEDIGGLDEMKKWFTKVAKAFKNPEKAKDYGLPSMKGALIIGVSGTGKSLTALENPLQLKLYLICLVSLYLD
jgi:hypothetical protein